MRQTGRRAGRWAAALAAIAGAVGAACVRVDTGPNVILSARLASVPPSIVLGDVLRDSAGAVLRLTALAFDESGQPIPTAQLHFTYVPTLRDTLNRLVIDTALVVDSATGAVRATATRLLPQAVVAVRVGDRLQLLDTLQIVLRPDSAAGTTASVPRFTFSCADPGTGFIPDTSAADSAAIRNASLAFGVTVLSDSGGVRGSAQVRSRLVRWTIISPASVATVQLPGGTDADTVPAIAVVDSATGARVRFDTTNTAGRSAVRLRVRAAGLGPTAFPDSNIAVVVRGEVQPGNAPVRGGTFTVNLRVVRRAAPQGATSYCR